jgi:small subunit ribosomal protein S21
MQNIILKIDERLGLDRSLRKFKRLCDSYGIVKEYRDRQEYKKPSVKNKEKLEAAQKRRLKTISSTRRFRAKI